MRLAGCFSAVLLWMLPGIFCLGGTDKSLESVLANMEKTRGDFRSFVADISTQKYTAILEGFEYPEKGKFYYKRAEDGSALIRWEVKKPGVRILTIKGAEALSYQPKIKMARKVGLGKNKDKAEYLVLGIGQSPADLKKTFNIAYLGNDKVNGARCSVLEFKPKGTRAAAMFDSIAVWINDATGVSVRMKMTEPFGDYIIVDFTDEKLNETISDSIFEQKLPADVDILIIN